MMRDCLMDWVLEELSYQVQIQIRSFRKMLFVSGHPVALDISKVMLT